MSSWFRHLTSFALLPLCIISCGKDTGGNDSRETEQNEILSETSEYRAVFRALNQSQGKHKAFGTAHFNQWTMIIKMQNLPGNMSHRQAIHDRPDCPSMTDDRNGDGILDYMEGLEVYGQEEVVLNEEGGEAPFGSSYTFNSKMNEAHFPSAYSLDKKTIVIYGVPSANIPLTALGRDGRAPADYIPIACGRVISVRPE